MGRVTVKLDAAQLDAIKGLRPGPTLAAFEEAAQAVVEAAQDELQGRGSIPVTVDTGALVRSVDVLERKRSGDGLVYVIGSRLDYAPIIHAGRGVVTPRRAGGVLRWPARGGGGGAFVFRTTSSAVDPRPFMTNALDRVVGALDRYLGR